MAQPITVTDQDFAQQVLNADLPVVVDFWAEWCPPCHAIAPTLAELADEYSGRLVVAKLNTDEHQRTMSELGVMGLPTLILFKNGQEFGRLMGARRKPAYQEWFNTAVDSALRSA